MSMDKVITTDETQKRENIVKDLGKNMFVEAGAGAGKTFLIVKRIMNMLSNGVSPGEIVVITFTNAAAEELRSRIAGEVRKEHIEDAMKHLDEMNISTIHSFCNVLLKEQSVVAGLPVDLEIIDEEEDTRLKRKALNGYLTDLSQDEWDRMSSVHPEGKDRKSICKHMERIYLGILGQPDDIEIVIPKEDSIRKWEDTLDRFFHSIDDAIFEDLAGRIRDKIANLSRTIQPSISNYDDFLTVEKDKKSLASANAKYLDEIITDKEKSAGEKMMGLLPFAIKQKNLWNKGGAPEGTDEELLSANTKMFEFFHEEFKDVLSMEIFVEDGDLKTCCNNLWFSILTVHAYKAAQYYKKTRPVEKVSNDRLFWPSM